MAKQKRTRDAETPQERPQDATRGIDDTFVDEILVSCKQGVIARSDIDRSISEYTATLVNPEILYTNGHKSFNNLLRYIYKHNLKNFIGYDTEEYTMIDYQLLDSIFCNIYIPLCYQYNRIPSINSFYNNLLLKDYSSVYDIKNGLYRTDNSKININTLSFLRKWTAICNGELLDNVMHTGNVGGMFVAKTRGFSDQPQNAVQITIQAPRIDEKQISALAAGQLPELPDNMP